MTTYSKNRKKIDESHINMEYLPLRIQTKIIKDIEHFLESQPNTSTSAHTNLIQHSHNYSLKSNDLHKFKTPGIIPIANELQKGRCQEIEYSDDDSTKIIVKKSSPVHMKLNNFIEPFWMNQAENIIKATTSIENLRVVNERLQRIILNECYIESWVEFNEYRNILQPMIIRIFERDLRFCCENNLDSFFWKTLFYNVLQFLKFQRKNIGKNDVQNFKNMSLQIVQDGLIFYENFIWAMEQKFNFERDSLLENNGDNKKVSSLVKVTIQKIYLNIGDLHRYQAQLEFNNGIEARKYYIKAQKLIPGNGVPYNQLAIIALNFNNYFEAVYYHIRSLTASNPIISAKESLKILLDEIRKKYDDKFKHIHEAVNISTGSNSSEDSVRNFRKEIWIHPNGSRRLRFQSDTFGDISFKKVHNYSTNNIHNKKDKFSNVNDSVDLDGMSNKELKKEFFSSYLYVVSKIYIGVNLDTFENAMFQMLYEFSNAINRYPSILNRIQLLEITTINIFLHEYNINKVANQEDTATNQQIRNYAFTVGLLMFGIIINRANDVLDQYTIELDEMENFKSVKGCPDVVNTKSEVKSRSDGNSAKSSGNFIDFDKKSELKVTKLMENLPMEFAELLQPIKIWCDWLSLNLQLCKSSICNYYQQITPWKNFANLLTSLSRIFKNFLDDSLMKDETNSLQLEENLYLMGFGPLKTILTKSVNYSVDLDDKHLAILYRIHEIIEFAINNLCSNNLSILNIEKNSNGNLIFSKNLQTFEQCQNVNSSYMHSDKDNSNESDDYCDSKTIYQESNTVLSENEENITDFDKLKSKKIMLEKSNKAQELYKEKLKNILEDIGNLTIMEVKPKYLVPDTNCFIDFLDELEYLVTIHNSYTLMVPLVVINELEGLTKGFKIDSAREMSWKMANSRIHHFDEVARISELSLNFIKNKNRLNIRCCTTRGSILKNSSAFTVEENDDSIYSNDDKILTSALAIATENYIKMEAEKSFISTEVVLLTTDRNLRVKALAKSLAVSGLKEFLNWTEGKETCFD